MIIDCISDLHGFYPKLKGGDLLIIAGDLTSRDTCQDYEEFDSWLQKQSYKKKIVIGGNHDNFMEQGCKFPFSDYDADAREEKPWADYLCDSGTEFEGLKIWGSPWTRTFKGMNPKCKAFTFDTQKELSTKWKLIPDDIDILVTHSPSYGIFDEVKNFYSGKIENVGSISLAKNIIFRVRPKLHIFGHIHEHGGQIKEINSTKYINASFVNEHYEPVNEPVRIFL